MESDQLTLVPVTPRAFVEELATCEALGCIEVIQYEGKDAFEWQGRLVVRDTGYRRKGRNEGA